MRSLFGRLLPAVCLPLLLLPATAGAQGWTFDARKIALGGAGDGNLASGMVPPRRPYRVVVMPFGIARILGDKDKFDPGSTEFDPVLLVEDVANPLHLLLNHQSNPALQGFVNDIRNARLNRDLNAYRGFTPAETLNAEGLVDSTLGYTFKIGKRRGGGFQGIRIGAGPYIPVKSENSLDPELIALLGSTSPVVLRNTRLDLASRTRGQLGVAVAAGYRAHIPWPADSAYSSPRDGLYIAADYDYIKGFAFADIDLAVRLDTDASGLITVLPNTTPIRFARQSATSGSGHAINLGAVAVAGPIEVGFGARGLGNTMTWNDVENVTYSLRSLTSGNSDFIESPTITVPQLTTEIPVEYRFHGAVHGTGLSVLGDLRTGFNGTSVHAGVEARTASVEVRGGLRYASDYWNPAVGVGLNLGAVGIDVSLFTTTANIERRRDKGIAASLRFMGKPKDGLD